MRHAFCFWVRRRTERFLRCFAATPHPSAHPGRHLPLKGKAWGAAAPEEGFGCGGGWRGDYPSVSFADSSPDKGERAERCQWQEKRGERVAAVEKIEEKRKPEDFFGHRNRRALGAEVDGEVFALLRSDPSSVCPSGQTPSPRGEGLGRCRASATMDIAFEDKRRRACCRAQRI